jgi:hypothetical protein
MIQCGLSVVRCHAVQAAHESAQDGQILASRPLTPLGAILTINGFPSG